MSDKGGVVREWRCYIHDMIGFCEKVGSYTRELDRDAFIADDMLRDATLRNLELIGEAATRIPDAIRKAHPEIPWRAVVGVRNRLARGYPGIDDDAVRSIVRDRVPALPPALRNLLTATDGDGERQVKKWSPIDGTVAASIYDRRTRRNLDSGSRFGRRVGVCRRI